MFVNPSVIMQQPHMRPRRSAAEAKTPLTHPTDRGRKRREEERERERGGRGDKEGKGRDAGGGEGKTGKEREREGDRMWRRERKMFYLNQLVPSVIEMMTSRPLC